ncbi:hypothetical protein K2224_18000 [Streptomyces sp. BHT-5-2]|uniref:hypothetical protein n=1 Tax=Streptomyces sp. BHT-5-2 TaxID=2866715 RepID=UPI001C8EF08F|nr:hypothetical protein [Streptomyces sp. BHT-5-2]QZL04803.1 hypothetical protein K2224_18000 [Streptomyces sp. BHT-5-2]
MVATGAVVGWGWFGCLPLGVMFLVAGLLVPPHRPLGRTDPHPNSDGPAWAGSLTANLTGIPASSPGTPSGIRATMRG